MRKLFGYLLFLITLTLYVSTTCPTVYVGDGGELISAAYLLGIPHAPGYPLFCLLGNLFTYLPLGTIAFRVNLVAAFFAASTVLLLFYLLKKIISGSGIFALLFAAIFAFSEAFWSQATHAKGAIYIINVFFLVLVSYMLVIWFYDRKNKFIYLASLFYGLALTNHHTALAFIPGFLLFVYFSDKKKFLDLKLVGLSMLCFAAGLLLYLYLPIRAAEYPLINSNNPADLKGMLDHILRRQYGGLSKNGMTLVIFWAQLGNIFTQLNKQFSLVLVLVAAAGLYYSSRQLKPLFYLTLGVFLMVVTGVVIVINSEITAATLNVNNLFFIPAYVSVLLWVCFGTFMLKDRFRHKFVSVIVLAVVFFFVFSLFRINFRENNKSSNSLAYYCGVNSLRSCDTGGIIFGNEDTPLYQLAYLQFVEKARPDVIVCDENGTAYRTLLSKEDKGVVYKNFLSQRVESYLEAALRTNRPIYHTIESGVFANKSFKKTASGILYKIEKPGTVLLVSNRIDTFVTGASDVEGIKDIFNRDMLARYEIFAAENYFSKDKKEEANNRLEIAKKLAYDMDWVQHEIGMIYSRYGYNKKVLEQMERARDLHHTSFERRNNLGNAYMGAGRIEEAIKEFDAAAASAPEIAAPFHNRGIALTALGRRAEAKKSYEASALLGQAESFQALLNMYMQDNELDKALEKSGQMIRANPKNADTYTNIGIMYQNQGKVSEAEKVFKSILGAKPGDPFAGINLGNIYINQGKTLEAAAEYENCLRYNLSLVDAYYNLGVAYLKLNRQSDAKQAWMKVLELKPDHADAKEALKYVK